MDAGFTAQVDLEKAWLEAWYDQKYWMEVRDKLDSTLGNASMDATLTDYITTKGNLEKADGDNTGLTVV